MSHFFVDVGVLHTRSSPDTTMRAQLPDESVVSLQMLLHFENGRTLFVAFKAAQQVPGSVWQVLLQEVIEEVLSQI